jgi:hypothetical protein
VQIKVLKYSWEVRAEDHRVLFNDEDSIGLYLNHYISLQVLFINAKVHPKVQVSYPAQIPSAMSFVHPNMLKSAVWLASIYCSFSKHPIILGIIIRYHHLTKNHAAQNRDA